MNIFEQKIFKIILIAILTFSNVACAKDIKDECDFNNNSQKLTCLKKKNQTLKMQLDLNKNAKINDFHVWSGNIEKKCEGKKVYTLGEGAALIREECYRNEYVNRLNFISSGKSELTKDKSVNDDGFLVTYLPYYSDDHINCLLSKNKKSCDKINLVAVNKLSKVYNFIDISSGSSVVFPETKSGVTLIAQPSSSESGGSVISLVSVNALGLTNKISLDASKNIIIDKNYRISFFKNGKIKTIAMNGNGEFDQ
ncbi:hypothetical protein D7V64_10510 [Acinetobacter cumulans]|uniref:Uncharacterized protein n=1 Tax=Acinetobacter cumulans TaxID=2136182 RepID=A0A3A8G237_9GAMM|nr:hypothetical protein [Acinetobacter cumulans]RKG52116.1 hypothetical protein D7V64_10510 [Acinetobacter cumulans]